MAFLHEFWSVKATMWFAVLYQESMRPDWRDRIADILNVEGAYIEHEPDRAEKKEHVHLLFKTSNTTRRHARDILNQLTRDLTEEELKEPDKHHIMACSTIQTVQSVKSCWEYMIHNTEDCIKHCDKLYSPEERHCINGFDYVNEIVVEEATLNEIRIELSMWILETRCCDYSTLYHYALSCNSELLEYEKTVVRYSAHFDRMCRAEQYKKKLSKDEAQIEKEKNSMSE